MEAEVHVRCRKSDFDMILEVAKAASDEYKKLLQ
jgi:hypothetical protein